MLLLLTFIKLSSIKSHPFFNYAFLLDFGRKSAADSLPPPPPPPEDEDRHTEGNGEDAGINANQTKHPDAMVTHLSGK